VDNASAVPERVLKLWGAELSAWDLEAIERWGWIPGFVRNVDRWIDGPADACGDEYEQALGLLRRFYLA